ncbi:MAG: histidine phosphatase family protein [Acidimicrobiales bacterium]
MELILVRHARPEHIIDADGPADPPLTDVGHRQARAVAAWLAAEPLDALYTSPLVRARQTAAPIERLLGLEAVPVHGVREYDAADTSYVPIEVLRADKDAWRRYVLEEAGIDRTAFGDEVAGALEDLIDRHRGQRIVVVCHGGVINAWAARVLGMVPTLFFNPDYTSINRFMAASSGERSVVSLNETAHLRGAPDLRL